MVHTVRVSFLASIIALAMALPAAAASSANPAAAGNNKVVATIGHHRITEAEVKARVGAQLTTLESHIYELKSQAIQSIADDYLLDTAAARDGVTPAQYITRTLGAEPKVTSADALKYYNAHKTQLPHADYKKLEQPLIDALQRQRHADRREQVLARLRAKAPLSIMLTPPRMKVTTDDAPALGPKNAPITIVEFGDFQCPFCKMAESSLATIRHKYGNKLRLVFLDFPLSIHAHALDAARAARCANEQGRFWPFHDALFANQAKLAPADLKTLAGKMHLNTKQFDKCLDSGKYNQAIQADIAQGTRLGVNGTPAFFINGRPLMGAQPPSRFETVIDDELARVASARKTYTRKTASR